MGKTRKMYTSSGWISGSDPTGCRKQRKWWESNSSEKEQMIPIHILWIIIHVYSIMMNISMYGMVIQLLYVYGVYVYIYIYILYIILYYIYIMYILGQWIIMDNYPCWSTVQGKACQAGKVIKARHGWRWGSQHGWILVIRWVLTYISNRWNIHILEYNTWIPLNGWFSCRKATSVRTWFSDGPAFFFLTRAIRCHPVPAG